MKKYLLPALIITALFTLYACNCKNSCSDNDYQYTLTFKGFDSLEVTPFHLRSYGRSSNFTNLLDSQSLVPGVVYNYDNNGVGSKQYTITRTGNDTTDYMILTRSGEQFLITNFTFPIQTCSSCSKKYQIHTISGGTINGVANTSSLTGEFVLQKY